MQDDVETVARAMREAVLTDGEGNTYRLFDLLDFSGENKAHMVVNQLAAAALSAAAPGIEARVQRETIDALNQPGSMQVHMLRGIINPMPLLDCLHLHGITAKENWGALTIDEAIALVAAAAIRKGRP